ncbi:MAG: PAS domain S-box protein, partial [Solirubrobacterales bacterium]
MAGTLSFERLFDAAPAAILVSDESRRVVHANAEASRLLGYRPGELVGRNTEVIVPEELREEYAQGREQYLADGEQNAIGSSFEARLLLSDGSELPVEASASIVETEAGKLIVTVLRDLSAELEGERERRELETTLKRATGGGSIDAQLEQTGRLETVGQLAGSIAHDFNN